MKPSPETLNRFKRIFKEEFGEELTDEAAFEKFSRLVNALRVIISGCLDIPDKSDTLGPERRR